MRRRRMNKMFLQLFTSLLWAKRCKLMIIIKALTANLEQQKESKSCNLSETFHPSHDSMVSEILPCLSQGCAVQSVAKWQRHTRYFHIPNSTVKGEQISYMSHTTSVSLSHQWTCLKYRSSYLNFFLV